MSDGRKSILFTSHYSLNGGLMLLGFTAEGKDQLVRKEEKSTPKHHIVVASSTCFFRSHHNGRDDQNLYVQKQSFKSLFCFRMQKQERRNKAVN